MHQCMINVFAYAKTVTHSNICCRICLDSVINHAIQKLHLYLTWIGLALNAWRNMGQARYCKCYSQMHLTSECQLNIHEIRPQKSRIVMFQSTLVSCFTCSIIEPLMWVRYTHHSPPTYFHTSTALPPHQRCSVLMQSPFLISACGFLEIYLLQSTRGISLQSLDQTGNIAT